jgi:hypothetical protein
MNRFRVRWIVPGLVCGLLIWGTLRSRSYVQQDLGIPSWPPEISAAERMQMLRMVRKDQWLTWRRDLQTQFGLEFREFVILLARGHGWLESVRLTEVKSPTPRQLTLTLYGSTMGFIYRVQKQDEKWVLQGGPDLIIVGTACP